MACWAWSRGLLILVAILLILDPYYTQTLVRDHVGVGEFTPLRTLHGFLDTSLTASILRNNASRHSSSLGS